MNPTDLAQAIAGSPLVLALGWTLVHFLWQGFALGLLFALVHQAARGAGPAVRYSLGMAVLATMLLTAVVTFALVYTPGIGAAATVTTGAASGGAGEELAGWRALLEPAIPWAAVVWVLGLAAQARGLACDFRALRHITANARPLPPPWPETVDRLRRQLGIRRCVRVLESVRVGVPVAVGWLRPVIIIPPSAILGLTPRQLELIISHELAHVARLDYLSNLAQILVETLFFFHPAVRFVSRCVRFEREHCCDDAVVARTGETLAYARALAEIEGLRCSSGLRPAAAATGGHLRGRIARLVALPSTRRGAGRWLAGVALLGAVAVAVFGGTRFATRNAETLVNAPVPAAATMAPAAQETVPSLPAPSRVPVSDRATAVPEPVATASSPMGRIVPAAAPAVRAGTGAAAAPAEETAKQAAEETVEEPAAAPARVAVAEPTPPAQPSVPSAIRPTPVAGSPDESPADPRPGRLAAGSHAAPASPDEPGAPDPPAPVSSSSRGPSAGAPPPAPSAPGHSRLGRITGGELIRSPDPGYPRRARLNGVEGQVTVRYGVDLRGRVEGVEVLSADPGEIFVAAVRKAVRRWRHEPFLADGEPVGARVTRTFEFAIRREPLAAGEKPGAGCQRVTGSRLCRSQDAYQELGIVVVHNPL